RQGMLRRRERRACHAGSVDEFVHRCARLGPSRSIPVGCLIVPDRRIRHGRASPRAGTMTRHRAALSRGWEVSCRTWVAPWAERSDGMADRGYGAAQDVAAIARWVGRLPPTVRLWLRRYRAGGVAGQSGRRPPADASARLLRAAQGLWGRHAGGRGTVADRRRQRAGLAAQVAGCAARPGAPAAGQARPRATRAAAAPWRGGFFPGLPPDRRARPH